MSPSFVARLVAIDDRLKSRGIARLSLDPNRETATPLGELGERVGERITGLDEDALDALAEGLEKVTAAMTEEFPDNIFGDLDFLVAQLARQAATSSDPRRHLDAQLAAVVELHGLFGCHSPIRFRYVHDFIYGYDWAKWVRRDPRPREDHGPFSPTFLAYTERRGQELLELIDAGDAKYHPLGADERARNPFGFSREPDAEIAIHRHLASQRLIPVETWRFDAEPRWKPDFAELRRDRAVALGYGLSGD
jgi:hypothetical protein